MERAAALRDEVGILRKQITPCNAVLTKTHQYMEEFREKQAETDRFAKQLLGKPRVIPLPKSQVEWLIPLVNLS